MLFIRSFRCNLNETEKLADWLKGVASAIDEMPYHRLRLLTHEAFVNACKFAKEESGQIIVLIRKSPELEIVVTDPGKGFDLPGISLQDQMTLGHSWQFLSQSRTSVHARLEAPSQLRFYLAEDNGSPEEDLKENHRGLISMLRVAKDLHYHFAPHSFNYIRISC